MLHPRPADRRTPAAQLARARWLLLGLFALQGITVASWLARLPAVRDALGMTPSGLGAVLLAGAVGGLVTVAAAGPIVTRFGGLATMNVAAGAFAASFLLLGLGPALGSTPLLTAGVFLGGVAAALGNVPLNVESAGVERRMGRSVLPQFHAAFSIGAVLGSIVGALTAHLEVPLLTQFAVTAVVGTACRLASNPHVILDTHSSRAVAARLEQALREQAALGRVPAAAATNPLAISLPLAAPGRRRGLGAALGAWREPRTLLIGLVVMAAALSEGAANDWLALAVVDGFDQQESMGAVFFGLFLAAMTVVRLLGTRLLDRFEPVAVLRVSGIVSLAGLALFGFASTLPLAGVGVVAWGLGAALAIPIGISAASSDPLRAAGRVAVISAFASIAALAAPPLLGIAAETLGTRHALMLIGVAMIVSVVLSQRAIPAHAGPVADSPLPRPFGASDERGVSVNEYAPVPAVPAAPTLAATELVAAERVPATAGGVR